MGKTNIGLKYCRNEFREEQKNTIGHELSKKIQIKEGRLIELIIWDTSGEVLII